MVDLARALERLAHVPGAQLRRAIMLGQLVRHSALVAEETREQKRLLVHDAAAAWQAPDAASFRAEQLLCALSWYADRDTRFAGGAPTDGVYLAAAALGDVDLLGMLILSNAVHPNSTVDVATLLCAAAANGHRTMVAWLWKLKSDAQVPKMRTVEPIGEALEAGARRALEALTGSGDGNMVEYIKTLLHADGTTDEALPVKIKSPVHFPTNNTRDKTRDASGMPLTQPAVTMSIPDGNKTEINKDPTTTPTEITATASKSSAVQVLSDRSLMSVISTFQECPHAVVEPLIRELTDGEHPPSLPAVTRLAIIHGNLFTLKAACLLSKVRSPDLPLLLHFAACEGHLDMVKWLHNQFAEDTKCRPDTMAMVVRCGWAEIVEWLYLNCPESAQTLSSDAWNDAAHWGHVDVLHVCHKYSLAESAPGVLTHAIGGGHLQIVQLLHSLEWGYDRNLAMREALSRGQLQIVRWLHTEEAVSSGLLVEALCSSANTAVGTVHYMLRQIDPSSDLVSRCIVKNFSLICEKAKSTTIATVLPMIPERDGILFEGILAATKAARRRNVEFLLLVWRDPDSELLDALLQAAMGTEKRCFVAWLMRQSCFTSANLDRICAHAVERQSSFLRNRDTFLIKAIEVDPMAETVLRVIHRLRHQERTRDDSESGPPIDKLGVERALLECTPVEMQPQLVACLVESGLQLESREPEHKQIIGHVDGVVRLLGYDYEDVDGVLQIVIYRDADYHLLQVQDDEVGGYDYGDEVFGRVHYERLSLRCVGRNLKGALRSPFCAVQAARTGNRAVLEFLHDRGILYGFVMDAVVAVAYAHDQLEVLEWVLSHSGTVASGSGMQFAMARGQLRTMRFIVHLHDDRVDRVLQSVLFDKMRQEAGSASEWEEAQPTQSKLWAITLLRIIMHTRPDQHQSLLEIAAEAGYMTAVKFILQPQSGFDLTSIQLSAALIAAACGGNEAMMKMLYENKQPSEQIDVDALRKLAGKSEIDAVERLLRKLSEWDAGVRRQVDEERTREPVFLPADSDGRSSLAP